MSLLFTIVRAAHANGTHHKLALDALTHLTRPDAEQWRRVFLKHAAVYMEGAKAPDDTFKDFKNHVLHVRDGYWGGAPEKSAAWYQHVIDALREGDFARAAYAAGVLSHYVTDPIHPFHTAQSEAENAVHRAVEWSINRAYDSLLAEALLVPSNSAAVVAPAGDTWLKAHVIAGAERANRHYETLIAHYDIRRGVSDPPAGLDAISRRVVGGLIIYAARSFAAVLDRAIDEAGVAPPEVSLTAETVLATLAVPRKWIEKRITDAATRRQVEAMYDELLATGRVDKTLPEDDRMVRDLHAREVLEPQRAAADRLRAERLAGPPKSALAASRSAVPAVPPPARADATAATATLERPSQQAARPLAAGSHVLAPSQGLATLQPRERRRLKTTDPVEAAPSIGPKLAQRLAPLGIATIGQFLAADPAAVAKGLGDRRFTSETISAWQDQARLVVALPGLRGAHAELLVGAGFRTVAALADADPATLMSSVLAFSLEAEGRRILRSGETPDLQQIDVWIRDAKVAAAA